MPLHRLPIFARRAFLALAGQRPPRRWVGWATVGLLTIFSQPTADADRNVWGTPKESQRIFVRDPADLPTVPLPDAPPPLTVRQLPDDVQYVPLSLNEAVRRGLDGSPVVRVLSGVRAANSGISVFDPAIAHTQIDEQTGAFDPGISTRHDFLRNESPSASFDPADPSRAIINGSRLDGYNMSLDVRRKLLAGTDLSVGVDTNRSRIQPGLLPLNPQTGSSLTLNLSQPLWQGAGRAVNEAPIVLARIDTESSFFRLKSGLQETVRGVIQAYWNIVAARTNVWAVKQQIRQAEFAVRLEAARKRVGLTDQAQLSQTRLALASFRSSLITAQSQQLDAEASLRSMLGMTPAGHEEFVPVSPPTAEQYSFRWEKLLDVAQQQRPDIIELKLILEADYQRWLLTRDAARPQLDASMLYRWNGLEGEMPIGRQLESGAGDFTDWGLGVNFSVPLGQRAARAALRRQELVIARDRANLAEAVLQLSHELAAELRRIDQFYAQYLATRETRAAAEDNLRQQMAAYRAERLEFINVLQAITDWGNAVSGEAAILAQYNTALASLEVATGTILAAHGVRLYEERYHSLGPLGILGAQRDYPRALRPQAATDRYPVGNVPAEETFNLTVPDVSAPTPRRLPPPVSQP